MKIIAIVAAMPRAGIDFFQSLLDGHPEISQFPGNFYFDEFWPKLRDEKKSDNVARLFINNYEHFFDSKINLVERHYMLGKDKKDFFSVNKGLFVKYFIDLMKNKNFNKKNLLCCLTLAYSKASGEDLSKKKIIILHLHHIYRFEVISELDYEIVCTIRDPLASYTSIINNWPKLKNKRMDSWSHYFQLNRIFCGIKEILNYQKKTYVIQLEKLHIENIKVMKDFCSKFDILYNHTMAQSTYHGKQWWGDAWSNKDFNGVNPNFKNNIDKDLFFKKDIECFETYLKFFLLKYNYPLRSNGLKYSLFKYLPFKGELKILKNAIAFFNFKEILYVLIHWVKRIKLMNKKNQNYLNFPNSIG